MRTLQRGRKSSVGPVRCSYYPAPNGKRVTVIISKKTAKHAVDRNLAKRRVRAALSKLPLPPGDLAVSLFSGAPLLTYLELQQSLAVCLAKFS